MNNDSNNYLSWSRLQRSVQHALRGFQQAVATEHSFRVHVTVASAVTILLVILQLNPIKTAIIVFVMATILVLELVNTVVERFAGLLEPRLHPYVGVIKDLMAAAVMVVTVAAVIVGWLLISPAFFR